MSLSVSSGLSKDLPSAIQHAVDLIVALTGENPNVLVKMTPEELITILCKLLQAEKEKVEELLESHDQNQEMDMISLAHLWKLVQKSKIKAKKSKFGSMDDKAREFQLFETARRMEQASIAPQKMTPKVNLNSLFTQNKHTTQAVIAANQNAPSVARSGGNI